MCTLCQSFNPSLELTGHEIGEWPSITPFETSTSASSSAAQNSAMSEEADAAAGVTTAYSITHGDTFSGDLSSMDEADWIQIDLAGGELLHVELVAFIDWQVGVNIYDSTGKLLLNEIYYDNDQSFIVFYNYGSEANTYYLEALNYGEADVGYTLEVNTTEYQEGTYDQIAEGLTKSWMGIEMAYDIIVSGTVNFNHDGLTADGKFLAEAALEAWTAVSGINFQYDAAVTSTTGLLFEDNDSGAFAGPGSIGDNGVINGSSINVGTAWLSSYGTTVDSYSFLT